eukprot:TRINITY_DN2762_c0_g1_i1.p1 TRINITY_DN2762_c0_g1~~TRINITY_DN2762_c0_g1_i1.p1  ORF type:complete len:177 (+),score=93.52 TRINITY_DN2762_c0_g1_i1:45-575(+)
MQQVPNSSLLSERINKPVILFDGECAACDVFVRFVIERDLKAIFLFAPLQSEEGKRLCIEHGVPLDLNTVVLIEGNKHFIKSTAVLRVCSQLSNFWPLLYYSTICIPTFIRDIGYSTFANLRYTLFGKLEICSRLNAQQKQRLLTFYLSTLTNVSNLQPLIQSIEINVSSDNNKNE